MNRRVFLILSGGLLVTPLAAGAQQTPVRVGVLSETPRPPATCKPDPQRAGNAFGGALTGGPFLPFGGPARGKNEDGTICEPEPLQQQLQRASMRARRGFPDIRAVSGSLDDSAKRLVEQNVAAIVAMGTPATLAAKRATNTIPIIMVGVADPVRLGLISSLARPGGNLTGVSFLGPEVVAKSLDILAQAAPTPTRVAVLWNPGNPSAALVLGSIQSTSRSLRIELVSVGANTSADVPQALDTVQQSHVSWLLILDDAAFSSSQDSIVEFALKEKLPTVFHVRSAALNGGLIAYGPSEGQMYELTGSYLTKILKGDKPADLPVEQPTTFELVINLKTAKALGLTIPQSLLQRADQVIE